LLTSPNEELPESKPDALPNASPTLTSRPRSPEPLPDEGALQKERTAREQAEAERDLLRAEKEAARERREKRRASESSNEESRAARALRWLGF
jgi:hypothetical protein